MIKIENTEVVGFEPAIRGMRNPMNSWYKSDTYTCAGSGFGQCGDCTNKKRCINDGDLVIGDKDHKLMMNLSKAGTDHRKFMRMIVVYVDVTTPLYWWKEFDTYKVGTVANSCSTMHKIHDKEFTLDDFSHENLEYDIINDYLIPIIEMLNSQRANYNNAKSENETDWAKHYWWQMIQMLPSSYNQKRTLMLNYEVLANIYHSRKNHKLDEWRDFCKWIETLPYSELIIGDDYED